MAKIPAFLRAGLPPPRERRARIYGAPVRPGWFWTQVEMPSAAGCWPWTGRKDTHGYGLLPDSALERTAHRMAYATAVGPIPAGAVIRHSCDNPACCNPRHLALGTARQNIADRQQRGRQAKGSRNGRAKSNEELVAQLRAGTISVADYCEAAGVSRYTAYDTLAGRIWKG